MPKRKDIKKVLIIGSGPIIIGQACEFDYSGTQACKALRSLGYEIVLVNSNPATIMTDPTIADATYIEPLNIESLERIIAKERPDALLPNLGGQSGLNLSLQLENEGVLKKYGVKIIGVDVEAIQRGEDRIIFKEMMENLGIDMPKSEAVYSVDEALRVAGELGYPVVVRPAYTMGGTGGGLVYNVEELKTVAGRGLAASMINQVLIEESVLGWEELELEIVRDSKGKMITVCFIENVDPMGTHTGDSFCTAPMLTVSDQLQKRLQKHAYDIVESVKVIGGTNVQFAHDPVTDRITVIEINPRTSRSSALASKATGFPIALISAKLAVGLTLDEIPYWKGVTLDQYEPSGDYIVVKFARWAFEKFKGSHDKLGTQMKAVGEVMSIGKTYKEAFQKAIRSLENSRYGLGFAKNFNTLPVEELLNMLKEPSSERHFIMYEALRNGASIDQIHAITKVKQWFIQEMKELVDFEESFLSGKTLESITKEQLTQAKEWGFSDRYLAKLTNSSENAVREKCTSLAIARGWDCVNVSGVETPASYYYSSTNTSQQLEISKKPKVMILGGGPNRIGQGIEFDYCCVHAAFALRDLGYETVMVNCNPETVSTDYDTSDRLYFEPLTLENVLNIYNAEKPDGVVVQFGGQTPLNLANELAEAGVKILGTPPDIIDLAEDRDRFDQMMKRLNIPMPPSGMAVSQEEALSVAESIGYPVMVRPSYVLGGRGMEIVHDDDMLKKYMDLAVDVTPERPILIDKFLENAIEAEADALCDGEDVFVPSVMEHIEQAGIHSGDSACVIPPVSIKPELIDKICEYTKSIAKELKVIGLMNMQYAIAGDTVYVIEANPRASRTVPLVSKVCNLNMAKIATELMMGKKIKDLELKKEPIEHYGVKEAVFPFHMFPEVDPVLGPEMRSTGEVLGIDKQFGLAFFKAQEGANQALPIEGKVLISVSGSESTDIDVLGKKFLEMGFGIVATRGTHLHLSSKGIESQQVNKLHEGRPNILDMITNGEIQLIINTPVGKTSQYDDSYIRKAAVKHKIPYITTLAAAHAAVNGISERKNKVVNARSLQEYQNREQADNAQKDDILETV
ncbi:carbamoyl-phosphate synthase large subunit [Chitinispirillales bacterium ANBcel5]|uniref:carbamoyl-phosphate synthase large subunit n=1 Tax=Cellulosispirillum alkaliphilum TaxID=3039283 RepID=UPI002A4ECCC0|nr:carbamoyl-phosphate synthase large subunit [Chitinispirillales bacterium ANBcel5]